MPSSQWVERQKNSLPVSAEFDDVLAGFLAARGFTTPDEAHQFLQFGLKHLKDPSCLQGMDAAVTRLVEALKRQESICIYGDFDMDGTPALALVYRGLRGLGYKNLYYCQPDRHADGYGFHFHLAERFLRDHGVTVFITVDVGITDVETVRKIQQAGADVILTDHHQVLDQTPPAFSVINPNQPGCESGMGYLCGTGVGFYLIMALRRSLKEQGLGVAEFDIKTLLDAFAIGTIADMVPLVKENRILVKHGLKVLEKTSMIGIQLLLQALKMNEKTLGAQDVAIRFVPKLNSLTRLDVPLKPIELFLVDDPAQAALMVQTVLKNNEHRVALLDEAEALIEALVAQKPSQDVLFFWSEHFHKGLVGLLATKLVNQWARPAFVGALTKKGVIVGSARAPEGSGLSVVKALQEASAHLNKFGGHPAAAGFELDPQNALAFEESLRRTFDSSEGLAPQQMYDLVVQLRDLQNFMKWWDVLEPFGQQFSPPVFLVENLKVQKITVMKNTHLKITVKDPSGFLMECVWFFPPQIDFFAQKEDNTFSLLCEPQWNEFMGSRRIQLLLKDIRSQ